VLLENDENNKALIMKMVATRGNDYEIILNEPEIDARTMFISIRNLYEVSLKRDDLRIFNYFKALINLNAEMCLQRNYRGINSLEAVYPLEQVYACTVNENVHLLLRASFAKFLLHLHIDKDPLENVTVPYLARVWPEIVAGSTTLPRSKAPINGKLLMLKPFAAKFFGDLGGVQKAFETDFNTYIVELLSLVDTMVRLGFYTDEDDLIRVVDPLISLLDGSLDIIDIEQMQRKNTSKNNSFLEGGPAGDNSSPAGGISGPQLNMSGSQMMNSMAKQNQEELQQRAKRYKMNESNLLIMATKNNIISILQRVLDI
jgi:inositol 1,4,5-triphosphate receptor type 1